MKWLLCGAEVESLAELVHSQMARTGKERWRVTCGGLTCWAHYGRELSDLRDCFLRVSAPLRGEG